MTSHDLPGVQNPFPYPGGKAYQAQWITEYLPDHRCYCEPFAGSAAVLFNKPPSTSEIINDQDGDVVQFFRVLRERPDDLREWVRERPFARDLHRKYAGQFYAGYRPADAVERAGRFFYLRYSQYAGKYRTKSGFSSGATRGKARQYYNAGAKLDAFAERLREVQIENRDYAEILSRFDASDTVFYFDPPYLVPGDSLYTHGEFDHEAFVEVVDALEARWLVSYERLPEGWEQGGGLPRADHRPPAVHVRGPRRRRETRHRAAGDELRLRIRQPVRRRHHRTAPSLEPRDVRTGLVAVPEWVKNPQV